MIDEEFRPEEEDKGDKEGDKEEDKEDVESEVDKRKKNPSKRQCHREDALEKPVEAASEYRFVFHAKISRFQLVRLMQQHRLSSNAQTDQAAIDHLSKKR